MENYFKTIELKIKIMNILILGISGMIGHILYRHLALKTDWNIYGTLRSKSKLKFFKNNNLKYFYL